jgi:hypothetical protein
MISGTQEKRKILNTFQTNRDKRRCNSMLFTEQTRKGIKHIGEGQFRVSPRQVANSRRHSPEILNLILSVGKVIAETI